MDHIVKCELGKFLIGNQIATVSELEESEYIWMPGSPNDVFKRSDKGWLVNPKDATDDFIIKGHFYKAKLILMVDKHETNMV